ncbi:MAG: hypothetical protein LBM66_01795 [Bifidobacteriaceae bacterium]|nr:hypothetical protein [Bifidobacteriaceae bacterium]
MKLTVNIAQVAVCGDGIGIVAEASKSRTARVWEDGKVFDERAVKTNAKGRPLYRFTAFVELMGTRLSSVIVESPMELPANLPRGVVLRAPVAMS